MKPNRLFILLAALLEFSLGARAESLASIFTNAPTQAVPARRTSIIFIQCHGLGYGDLSCYGQTNFQTPNLDKLAAEGIRFENYSGGADFSAGLAALMTGKNSAFVPGEITLARRLEESGYQTGLIGEWTLDKHPWTQGFDEFAGFLDENESRNYYSDFLWRFAPRSIFDDATKTFNDYTGKEPIYLNEGGKKGQYLPEMLVNAMCNFVRVNQPDAANHYKPFFLLMDFPAPRSATAGADDFPVPTDAPFTDEPWPQAAKNRAALIMRIDGSIGRLFEQMKELGISNNVAIFFSSSAAPEPFTDRKMDFLKPDGSQAAAGAPPKLPMIVRWPEEVPAGRVSPLNWSGADFFPTALEIAYAQPVPKIAGISILPILRGQVQTNLMDLPDSPVPKNVIPPRP